MYSTVKKLSALSIIMASVNAIASLIYALYINGLGMDDMQLFVLCALLFSSPIVLVIVSIALRSASNSMEVQADNNLDEYSALRKRIEQLEKKLEQ